MDWKRNLLWYIVNVMCNCMYIYICQSVEKAKVKQYFLTWYFWKMVLLPYNIKSGPSLEMDKDLNTVM